MQNSMNHFVIDILTGFQVAMLIYSTVVKEQENRKKGMFAYS